MRTTTSSAQVRSVASISPFVPKESKREDRPEPKQQSWQQYLMSLCDRIDQEDEHANRLRYQKYIYLRRFVEGNELGRLDPITGVWIDQQKEPGDPIYVSNLLRYFVRSLAADDVSSQVVYDVASVSDQLEYQAAARLAGNVLAYVRRNAWSIEDQIRESKHTIVNGNSFRLSRPRHTDRVQIPHPVYSEEAVPIGGGTAHCTACNAFGEAEEFGEGEACPSCGAVGSVTVTSGLSVTMPRIIDFVPVPAVEIETRVVDPIEVKLQLQAQSLKDSGYLRHSIIAYTSALQQKYSWAVLGDSNGSVESNLLFQREAKRSPGNMGGRWQLFTSDMQDGTCEQRTYWLEPWMYADHVATMDEQFADDSWMKVGDRAIDSFPEGLALTRVGPTILHVWPERKSDVWVHRQWDMNGDSIWAAGIEDVVQAAKQYNEINSLRYEVLLNHASPKRYYNPKKFRRQDFRNSPSWAIPMRDGVTTADQPANYIYTEQPRAGDPSVSAFLDEAKRDMQLLANGTISPQGGMPDSDNPTARGKIIMRDAAQKMLRPLLLVKAAADVEMAKQILRQVKRCDLADYYAERTEGEYAEFELAAWRELNSDADLVVTARAGSEMPISEDDKANNMVAALTIGGIPMGIFNPGIPEDLRQMLLQALNLPIKADKALPDERKQRIEIRKMIEFAQAAEQQGMDAEMASAMAMMGQPKPDGSPGDPLTPVQIYADDHEVHVQHIVDFLKTDAGQKASPILQRLLTDHIQQHEQGAVMKAQHQQMLGMQAQAPMMGFQMAMQQQMGEGGGGGGAPAGGPPQAGPQKGGLPMKVGAGGSLEAIADRSSRSI